MKKKTTQRICKFIYTVMLPLLCITTDILVVLSHNITWSWLTILIIGTMNIAVISVAFFMLAQLNHVKMLPKVSFKPNRFRGVGIGFGHESNNTYVLLLPFVYFDITLKF